MPAATEAPQRQPLPDSQIPSNPPDLSHKLPSLGKPRTGTKAKAKPSNPPVETPTLQTPSDLPNLTFTTPVRRMLSPHDHELFLQSPTRTLITAFTFNIADSVKDVSISTVQQIPQHPTVTALLSILDQAEDVISKFPADDNNGSRFGNPLFRNFVSEVSFKASNWHSSALDLGHIPDAALNELTTYFANSFGSSTRIDYGSGHELNFLIYLLCLYQLSLLPSSALPSLALILFPRYLRLMRRLQSTYYLEPAGSHGVWGLDDYHFLPFLFGASQLSNHRFIRPLAIHSSTTIEAYSDDYLYLDMVRHVNSTKTVQGLRWHSPMLDDISGVREGWWKICDGMKRIFLNEVLGKLVVMQHFLFGGLVPAAEGMTEMEHEIDDGSRERDVEGHEDHVHNKNSWGDCCGIKVPSSVGAVEESKKHQGTGRLRLLPFD